MQTRETEKSVQPHTRKHNHLKTKTKKKGKKQNKPVKHCLFASFFLFRLNLASVYAEALHRFFQADTVVFCPAAGKCVTKWQFTNVGLLYCCWQSAEETRYLGWILRFVANGGWVK